LFAYKFNDYIGVGDVTFGISGPEQSFINSGSAKNWGFEVMADVLPVRWIKLSTNYSYQNLTNDYTVYQTQLPASHKFNFKTFLSLPHNFSGYLAVSHVDKSVWEVPTITGGYQGLESEANTRVDARVAWTADNRHAEFFVTAYNLLDSRYREYPIGEEIRRRLTTGFLISF
jgi:outer membrane receptor protein involved in Fe transport